MLDKALRLDQRSNRVRSCTYRIRCSSPNHLWAQFPFITVDVVGSVVSLVNKLGSEGLVGLAHCGFYGEFTTRNNPLFVKGGMDSPLLYHESTNPY